ncbi:MULE domain-containing protein [Trichostrongylus colubriformis]|uniref:MULE domain-containing protein n=1 Tax=Trichostrongylus colubriformis TaxID=6319 RepID=A0AAN8GFE3_TRICO
MVDEILVKSNSIDDTFNLTCYSLRLATVVVPDEWDKGLPAAFLLTNRMTEEEAELLFMEIKKMVPSFDPTYFMSDDANAFFNGFRRVFPQSTARKLLCVYHVVKAIERNCKTKLHDGRLQKTMRDSIVNKVRELCRTTDHSIFSARYSDLLAHLKESGETELLDYFERTWSPRTQHWGAFARRYSAMNTSMLIERFHRRLKHEVLGSKGNVRVDTLLDALVTLVPDMQEEREIKMSRGLWEGRHRLQEQHKAHALAIKMSVRKFSIIIVKRTAVMFARTDIIVTVKATRSQESHVPIFTLPLYAPEGKLTAFEDYCDPSAVQSEDWHEHLLDENANIVDENSGIGRETEVLQNMLQELDLITAAMRSHILQLKP